MSLVGCTEEGKYIVGQAEYEEQSSKHGGGREMAVLAKNIARVLVMMGLGPMPGTAMKVGDDGQCSLSESKEAQSTGHGNDTLWMILVLMLIVVAWSIFFWQFGEVAETRLQTATSIFAYRLQSWMLTLVELEQTVIK